MRSLIIALLALTALLGFANSRPDHFHVERSITIKAPADKIFAQLNDFHQWSNWSPYERHDPAMKHAFSGPEAGVGAAFGWETSSKTGAGRMKITESIPSSDLKIKMDFFKPFSAEHMSEFTLAPQGDGTTVTWSMSGPIAYSTKVIGLFFNTNDMTTKDFEVGLANLKTLSER